MKIGDLAEKTGVAPRLLRYYEEVGILHPFRSANGYRSYGEPAVDRVLQIRELLEAGLTTEMIREVLPCLDAAKEGTEVRSCPAAKDLDGLRRQLSSIERPSRCCSATGTRSRRTCAPGRTPEPRRPRPPTRFRARSRGDRRRHAANRRRRCLQGLRVSAHT